MSGGRFCQGSRQRCSNEQYADEFSGHTVISPHPRPNARKKISKLVTMAPNLTEPIKERTIAGLVAARARGKTGGRPKRSPKSSKVTLAKKLYADKSNTASEICRTLNISRATLYRYI